MGLPQVIINFRQMGSTAIQRGSRGTVVLILRDETAATHGVHILESSTDAPLELTADNKRYISDAFLGYQTTPKQVIAVVQPDVTVLADILTPLETLQFNWLAYPDAEVADVTAIATWTVNQYDNNNKKIFSVLANVTQDHESLINFTTDAITTADNIYTAQQYTARIAGLLAGTPITISATYAPLNEVLSFDMLSKADMDTAINDGQLILYFDGDRTKIARAVTSFRDVTADKGDAYKKIKLVETMNLINDDIKKTLQDNYIGKYANSYDNKVLLISVIQAYLDQLVFEGLLDPSFLNVVGIDIEQHIIFIKAQGDDPTELTEQQIKEYNTKDQVYLVANIKMLDAIEDITLNIQI